MRHQLPAFAAGLFGLAALATSLLAVAPVSAATLAATTTCSNGLDNAGGQGLICEVTIENTLTAVGGSASVTVRECHGAAGDPEAACAIQVSILTEPVTSVDQCNGSINGGGGTLRCSVQVRNTYVAQEPSPVGLTVNQCVGSGDGFTVGCNPFPATTTGATITQCNGSANGGTLVELTCAATGTQSDAFNVTINQCNGSGDGGGGLVICSSNIDSVSAVPVPTAVPTAAPTVAPTSSASPVATAGPAAGTATAPSVAHGPSLPQTDTALAPAVPADRDGGLLALIVVSGATLAGGSVLLRKRRA